MGTTTSLNCGRSAKDLMLKLTWNKGWEINLNNFNVYIYDSTMTWITSVTVTVIWKSWSWYFLGLVGVCVSVARLVLRAKKLHTTYQRLDLPCATLFYLIPKKSLPEGTKAIVQRLNRQGPSRQVATGKKGSRLVTAKDRGTHQISKSWGPIKAEVEERTTCFECWIAWFGWRTSCLHPP